MRTATRIGALSATAVLSLVLGACGGKSAGSMDPSSMSSSTTSSSPSSTSSTAAVDAAHNDQDVMFAQQMIVHHKSAIDMADMADMASTKGSSQEVKTLAASIKAAQSPEINTMSSWLTAWGAPATTDSSMSGLDHSMDMPGMMTSEQMDQLSAATGPAFDKLFLQMMTTHHQGAIEMAKTEQAKGSNPQAIALAGDIKTSQSAEVTQMTQMLTAMG